MRKVLRLAQREYLAAVRTKGFIIGLVLAPLLMSSGFIAIALMKDKVDTTDKRVAVVDRSGLIAPTLVEAANLRNSREVKDEKTGKKVRPAYLLETIVPNPENPEVQRLELSDRVRNGQLHAFLEIGAEIAQPQGHPGESWIRYYAKSPALDDIRRWAAWPINDQLRRLRLSRIGIEPEKIKGVFDWFQVEGMGLVTRDTKTGQISKAQRRNEAEAILVPMVIQLMIFFLFMMGAAPLIQAVMEEKSQRIAEVLLGSVTPFQMMLGKLIGGVAVALTGSAVYIPGGIFALRKMQLGNLVPYHVLPWFFVFMLLAIFMYGALMAALGSACSDSKDAQNLQLPVMLPLILCMALMGPLLKEPHSAFATGLSLFPPFTPMLMLMRLSTPEGVPLWQPWLGLLGVLMCTVAAIWAGGRVFRVGILIQGKAPGLAQILKWTFRG